MLSGEATHTNFIIFGVTRPGLEFTRCTSLEANTLTTVPVVQFEDTYGVIKSHKLKKNRQYNDQKKKDKKGNTSPQENKRLSNTTPLITEICNMNLTNNRDL